MRYLVFLIQFVFACTASAAVIDFQSLEHNDNRIVDHGKSYSEDGFTLTNIPFVNPNTSVFTFATAGTKNTTFYKGSTALFNNVPEGTNVLTKTGGGLFTLQSIDLASLGSASFLSVVFTGYQAGGSVVTQTFNATYNFSSYSFIGFNNLLSASWVQDNPYHQFDNITVEASSASTVPEPSTYALMLLGFGLIGFSSRRNAIKKFC